METKKVKCSSQEDKDVDAISYCGECKIYMCNKCEKCHKILFSIHQTYKVDNQFENIFTGFCKEPNHRDKLKFFCKNHNTLCCTACLCKIGKKGIGFHKDCDVCLIEDIKEEKKNSIKSNIKYLEEISNTFNDTLNNLKLIFEKIVINKEDLKLTIQNIFTKLRNELNNREDNLLMEIDKKFNELYYDENILKQFEKFPNKLKSSLEKIKKIELDDDNNLSLFINDCLNIENNIKDINKVNESIEKCKNENEKEIKFNYEGHLNKILNAIKIFGKIYIKENFSFDSSIINNDVEKQELIINWIREKVDKNLIKLEKIFVMSINGSSSKDFHKYCDNQGATLTLLKTTKNKIFGGFTPLDWESKISNKIDKNDQTFLFSLNKMKKYDMINKEKRAIYCNANNGPYFGGRDFSIESNMKEGEIFANQHTNFLVNNNLDLTDGKGDHESFEIEDFEIFKVIY